jgi:DNA modification methylase
VRRRELEAKASAAPATSDAWRIVAGDCLKTMNALPGRRFRLIFADPPYNESVDYGDGSKADRLPDADYLAWCGRWFEESARLLAPDGSLWVLISENYATAFDALAARHGLHRKGWIVWAEEFGVYRADYFGRCARHLFHFVRDPARTSFSTVRR